MIQHKYAYPSTVDDDHHPVHSIRRSHPPQGRLINNQYENRTARSECKNHKRTSGVDCRSNTSHSSSIYIRNELDMQINK